MNKYSKKSNQYKFYAKMQPYFDKGMVRIIYSSEDVVILALGEICYIACSCILINDEPIGIYATERIMRKVVVNNRYIHMLLHELLSDIYKHRGSFYNFPVTKIDIYEKWIDDNKNKGISAIDLEFERELAELCTTSKIHTKTGLSDRIKGWFKKK